MNVEQRPGCYFSHAQGDLNLRFLRMFEGTFSLDAVQICFRDLSGGLFLRGGLLRKSNVHCVRRWIFQHVVIVVAAAAAAAAAVIVVVINRIYTIFELKK